MHRLCLIGHVKLVDKLILVRRGSVTKSLSFQYVSVKDRSRFSIDDGTRSEDDLGQAMGGIVIVTVGFFDSTR